MMEVPENIIEAKEIMIEFKKYILLKSKTY